MAFDAAGFTAYSASKRGNAPSMYGYKTADTIADVNASGLWPGRVVTEVEPVGDFWEAEPEHQDYLERFPNGYTCHFPRPDWVLPKRDAAE